MLWFKNRRLSYKDESAKVSVPLDPLAFLNSETANSTSRDAFGEIHGIMHETLEEVDKSIQLIFEQLRSQGSVAERVALEANGAIRNEMARASYLAHQRKESLSRDIHAKLEILYIRGVMAEPHQDPGIKKWESLSARAVQRDLPAIPEYSAIDLGKPEERKKRLPGWQSEVDQWLEILCRNHVADVITSMKEDIKDYLSSWFEVSGELRRHGSVGGRLYQEVLDPDMWNFENEDPTVSNLLRGVQAQSVATRILERFQLSNRDAADMAENVRNSLGGVPVFGMIRVGIQELEELLALALADKIQETVTMETGFLSILSSGSHFRDDVGELLADMHRGASAMEQKVWRIGEIGVGHVDSAAGVGITATNFHDIVIRGLGGGRRFAAVEGHPGDNHRFNVQMSIVGAPASDLTIFREMVAAWYSWHFDENRGKCATEGEWLNLVKSECWKLYPDIGTDTGVRNAIIELIGQDLSGLWQSREGREGLVSHLTNNGLPSDQELLQGLWRELGVIPNGTVSKV